MSFFMCKIKFADNKQVDLEKKIDLSEGIDKYKIDKLHFIDSIKTLF